MFKILVISFSFFLVSNVFAWNEKSPSDLNIDSKKIEHLFDLAFSDDATQSVVLIKDGFLIGERYANGYDKESFGTSWSVAKSFYAALILISIDKGEIQSLDERIGNYINFNDERDEITIRQLLNMSSGLQYPWHQHEAMFFKVDHMEYAKKIELEKQPDTCLLYTSPSPRDTG